MNRFNKLQPTRFLGSRRSDTNCDVTVSKPSNLASPMATIFREFQRALRSIRLETAGLLIDLVRR